MKKKIIKVSLIVFIGLFMFTSGVVAAKLSAKDVGFTSTNEEWNVDNVEDAMNDLYNIGKDATKIENFSLVLSSAKGFTQTGASYTYTIDVTAGKTYIVFPYNNAGVSNEIVSNSALSNVQLTKIEQHKGLTPVYMYKFTALSDTKVQFSYSGAVSTTYSSITAYYLD